VNYQLDAYEPYSAEQGEGTERPLVRRVMAIPAFRAAYIAAYRDALTTFLAETYLLTRVTALEQLMVGAASAGDATRVQNAADEMRTFISARHANVSAELDGL
jgi:hypothetical protein